MEDNEKYVIQDMALNLQQVNWLNVISPLIFYLVCFKSIDLYTINRDAKPKDITTVRVLPDIDRNLEDKDIEEVINNISRKDILKFAKFLHNHFDNNDLYNFYNNIKTLEVKEKNFAFDNVLFNYKTAGEYCPKKNTIYLAENSEYAMYHELFHLASTVCNNKEAYSGFHHVTKKGFKSSLGKALNEGYTELLSYRYFPTYGFTYRYQLSCASKIEKIVGKERMEKLYLKADLRGLIAELNKYMPLEEIMKFITNMDFIMTHSHDKTMILYKESVMNRSFREVNEFLIKCYANYFKEKVSEGYFLTKEDIAMDLQVYMKSILEYAVLDGRKYNIMTEDEVECYLEHCLNSKEKSFLL